MIPIIKQSLFADQELEAKFNELGDTLQMLEQHVDFAALAAAVDGAAPRPSSERGGRPSFPTEPMVRVLRIQQLFNLSDQQMEFQLFDRLSFQRFVDLRHSSQIPDRTTIWTFKERLIQAGASESIFDAVNRQLSIQGYMARGTQMIDASIVQTPGHSISKEEKAIVSENATPADWKPAKRARRTATPAGPRDTASPTSATRSRPMPTSAIS